MKPIAEAAAQINQLFEDALGPDSGCPDPDTCAFDHGSLDALRVEARARWCGRQGEAE